MRTINISEYFTVQKIIRELEHTKNYQNVIISIKLNNNSFPQNAYYLNCDICENIICQLLNSPIECQSALSIDNTRLEALLFDSNYDWINDFFKTKEDAEKIADYINACILLHQLKM